MIKSTGGAIATSLLVKQSLAELEMPFQMEQAVREFYRTTAMIKPMGALFCAAANGHVEAVRMLLDRGAYISAEVKSGYRSADPSEKFG
ncbi:hypothetical protein CDV55_100050 [Aspergillus turcosus]|uniref:Uncharacterized protein n=1 Tax=Aspergillus turcosus TaxID=1245748 RepID=A0A229WH70_9EURO|nr:hypothetical protein CDV55_100050 [Aspergillus turcosus]RLL93935.1 hypothetical protein CFD26_103747 [Aspergillus turcosus]